MIQKNQEIPVVSANKTLMKQNPMTYLKELSKLHPEMFYLRRNNGMKYLVISNANYYETVLTMDDVFGTNQADNMQVNRNIFKIHDKQLEKHELTVVAELRKFLLQNSECLAENIAAKAKFYARNKLNKRGKLTLEESAKLIFWPMTTALFGENLNEQEFPHLFKSFEKIDDKFGVALRGKEVKEVTEGVIEANNAFKVIFEKNSLGPVSKFYHESKLSLNSYRLVTGKESEELSAKFAVAGWWGGQGNAIPAFVWTFYNLLRYEGVYQKLKTLMSESDEKALCYLSQALKETLRLTTYSVAWRTTLSDTKLENEETGASYFVPERTTIGLHFCINHLNSSVFPDEERFLPERFEGQTGSSPVYNKIKYAWVPFSAGRHKCSGYPLAMQEIPSVLLTLFKSYDFVLEQDPDVEVGFNFQQAFGVVSPTNTEKVFIKYRLKEASKL